MRFFRAAALALAFASPVLIPSAPARAETATGSKVALVDIRRVLLESDDGKRMQAAVKKLMDKQSVDLGKKKRVIDADKDKLEKELAAAKDKSKLERKVVEWQKRALDFDELQRKAVLEAQKLEQEQTAPIVKKVQDLIQRVARAGGYDLVLEKQAAVHLTGGLDVTDKVIKLCNDEPPAKALPPPPPPKGKGQKG